MELYELAGYLNNYLEINRFDEAAYNGIQVFNTGDITKIATAVTASLETIEQAVQLRVQALIVHHGIFRKQDMHPVVGVFYKKIKLLIEHNIALLCYHLPLDAHQEIGNNWQAARDLGLNNLKPFCYAAGNSIGVIGSCNPIAFDQLQKIAERYYGRSAESVNIKDPISTVAIVSGGADKFIIDAAQAGADCFITGRVDEPVWDHAHEYGISFLGFGHYSTETVGPQALAGHIQKALGIPSLFIRTDNPF